LTERRPNPKDPNHGPTKAELTALDTQDPAKYNTGFKNIALDDTEAAEKVADEGSGSYDSRHP
jgi:hypothetical protein